MFSRSDHHQQNAQKRGTRRPRSPRNVSPTRNSRNTMENITKSPGTDRILKKSRTDSARSDPTTAPDAPHIPPPAPPQPAQAPAPESTHIHTSHTADPVPLHALTKRLSAQLAAALETATALANRGEHLPEASATSLKVIIQSVTSILPHTTNSKASTKHHLAPSDRLPTGPRPKPTYAAITKQKTNHICTQPQQCQTVQHAGKSSPFDKIRASRIVVNFVDDLPTSERPSELHIRSALNEGFSPSSRAQDWKFFPIQFSGVQYTRYNSLILTLANGRNANELVTSPILSGNLKTALQEIFELDSVQDLSVHCDKPWLRLVIGRIPCQVNGKRNPDDLMEDIQRELMEYNENLMFASTSGSVPGDAILRVLSPGGILKGDETHVSLCITLDDEECARRTLVTGAFLFGRRCRVSWYKPRRRPLRAGNKLT